MLEKLIKTVVIKSGKSQFWNTLTGLDIAGVELNTYCKI